MEFPAVRPRRNRVNRIIRDLVAETDVKVRDLIIPIFVKEDIKEREEIPAMPGYYRYSIHDVTEHVKELVELGLDKILLFGIPKDKDEIGSSAYKKDGIVQRTIGFLRKEVGDSIVIITDVCMCQYTTHGHCGVVTRDIHRGYKRWYVDNDKSVEIMAKIALSHAEAGADIVAPSNMMDGVVKAIRDILDSNGYNDVSIMSYSVKYASNFYGPFREAAYSAPEFGDRKGYQMDPRNAYEAIKEASLDINEGADILMVKPALAYLDVIRLVKNYFPEYPLAAYNVSGEYSMIKYICERGLMDERKIVFEVLTSIKRAGADIIISYHSRDIANWIREGFNPFR